MEVDPPEGREPADSDHIAVLRHRHRNQIQNMTSLVGLFGRRFAPGPCRDAFMDLRARFEALGFVSPDERLPDDAEIDLDLPELAERLLALLDPIRSFHVAIEGGVIRTTAKRAETMSQVLGEIVLALFRGSSKDASAAAEITVTLYDRTTVSIRAASTGGGDDAADADDVGWSIAQSLVGNLGGTLERSTADGFVINGRIPRADPQR